MTKNDDSAGEQEEGETATFYEVEIDGRVHRIARARLEALAEEIAGQPVDLDERLRSVFSSHPMSTSTRPRNPSLWEPSPTRSLGVDAPGRRQRRTDAEGEAG